MKLIIAIVHDDDCPRLMAKLRDSKISVTKLASTGGFLHAGNVTLMIGTEKENVDGIIDMIRNTCETRMEAVVPPTLGLGMATAWPVEVPVGGATVFVLDIDRFEKL